jgi:hypothetical protein
LSTKVSICNREPKERQLLTKLLALSLLQTKRWFNMQTFPRQLAIKAVSIITMLILTTRFQQINQEREVLRLCSNIKFKFKILQAKIIHKV